MKDFNIKFIAKTPDPEALLLTLGTQVDYLHLANQDISSFVELYADRIKDSSALDSCWATLVASNFPAWFLAELQEFPLILQTKAELSDQIIAAAKNFLYVTTFFYFRPKGSYQNQDKKQYHYSEADRMNDIELTYAIARQYQRRLELGWSVEQCFNAIPSNIRRNFMTTISMRSLLLFLRKYESVDETIFPEMKMFVDLLWSELKEWSSAIFRYYPLFRS